MAKSDHKRHAAKHKIDRRLGVNLWGRPKSPVNAREYGPGQHGRSRFQRKSEYAIQLEEKQKAKYTYGLLEKQFRNLYEEASAKDGVTGENLLQYLESRLDNTIFRLGFARTRRQARQLVSHKHIVVNGITVNIPSYRVKVGDVISVRPKSRNIEVVTESIANAPRTKYKWLEVEPKERTGKYLYEPTMEEIPENINVQLIIELYSK